MSASLQRLAVCPGFEGKVSTDPVRIDNIEDFKPHIRLLKSLSSRPRLAEAEKDFDLPSIGNHRHHRLQYLFASPIWLVMRPD
jgi:hypothetical protein